MTKVGGTVGGWVARGVAGHVEVAAVPGQALLLAHTQVATVTLLAVWHVAHTCNTHVTSQAHVSHTSRHPHNGYIVKYTCHRNMKSHRHTVANSRVTRLTWHTSDANDSINYKLTYVLTIMYRAVLTDLLVVAVGHVWDGLIVAAASL